MLELYNDRLLDLFNTEHKNAVSSYSDTVTFTGPLKYINSLCLLNYLV